MPQILLNKASELKKTLRVILTVDFHKTIILISLELLYMKVLKFIA